MAAHLTPGDAVVIENYLRSVEAHLMSALQALDAGDTATLRDRLDVMVYGARQAQARAEQAVMLAEERGLT